MNNKRKRSNKERANRHDKKERDAPRLNVERVGPTTFRVTCKPKHDRMWLEFAPNSCRLGPNALRIEDDDIGAVIVSAIAAGYKIDASPYDAFLTAAFPNDDDSALEKAWTRVPPKIQTLCFPYQRTGIKQSLSQMGPRHWFCDEMGLGKSMASIAVMVATHSPGQQSIVVCPSYLRHNWAKEIQFWTDGDISTSLIMKTKDPIPDDVDVVVISYDLAVRKIKELHSTKWEMAICDESHYLKTRTSKRTKALTFLLHKIKRVLLLSGTPAMSRPAELFTQLRILYPSTFSKFYEFGKRYADLKKNRWGGFDESGASNTTELSLLMKRCMIRRLKKDVLKDLPTKLREDVTMALAKKDTKEFGPKFEQLRSLSLALQTATEGRARMLFNERQILTSALFRMTATAKIDCVKAYVTGRILNGEEKVIVWAHHQVLLDAIEEAVKACKVGYIRIDGKTNQAKRQEMVDGFRTNSQRVAVLSLMACSTGLNFTPVSHAIFAELIWSPSVLGQSEDRCHRIGATETCHYTYLIADGTLDAKIYKRIHDKFNTVDKIIDGGTNARGFETTSTSTFSSSGDASPDTRSLDTISSHLRKLGIRRFVSEFANTFKTMSASTTTLAAFLEEHGNLVPLDEADGLALRTDASQASAGEWEELIVGATYTKVYVITDLVVDDESILDAIDGVGDKSPAMVLGFGLIE